MTDTSQKKRRKPPKQQPPKVEEFPCEFCSRVFTTELRLVKHVCEQKRRYLQRDDKPVKIAFLAYQRFYQRSMRRNPPEYDKFAKSQLYTAFVRFGRHVIDLNAVNPMGFVDFLLNIEAPIDRWSSPVLYGTYIRELNKNETPLEAIERNFMLMQQWSVESGEDWRDFFRKIEPPRAALWIVSGRISPWVLLTASSAGDLMGRMSAAQLQMVEQAVDVGFWRIKLTRHQDEVELIRTLLEENGI